MWTTGEEYLIHPVDPKEAPPFQRVISLSKVDLKNTLINLSWIVICLPYHIGLSTAE
jgi:hypothetical protein